MEKDGITRSPRFFVFHIGPAQESSDAQGIVLTFGPIALEASVAQTKEKLWKKLESLGVTVLYRSLKLLIESAKGWTIKESKVCFFSLSANLSVGLPVSLLMSVSLPVCL